MNSFESKTALVIGGSRGIGKAIANELSALGLITIATSRQELDTSDPDSLEKYAKTRGKIDVLVLNTGGPEKKTFEQTKISDWENAHRQLFLGFVALLKNIKLSDNAYVFAIASSVAKEPKSHLVLSSPYRAALINLLKILSRDWAAKGVSIVSIAPDKIETERLKALSPNLEELAGQHPMNRLGRPEEIGKFVRAIVENDIKYLNGVTINFDGGLSQGIF